MSLTAIILTEVTRLKARQEKVFLDFKPLLLYMLIFVFLPALRMFLRCDVDVMQFQQNSKQHETF